MSNKNRSDEPSMEQILESISDIIADNGDDSFPVHPAELVPMVHTPVAIGNSPFDHLIEVQPIIDNPANGSLTDRLAHMEVQPVPEIASPTAPGFVGEVTPNNIEPVPVNMPVPQMAPHQPVMETGGFPIENAENFLANNAQPTQQQPEFSVSQAQIASPVAVQQPVEIAPISQQTPEPVPVQQAPVVQEVPAAPENVVMQPNEVTATVPETAAPLATADVLTSFKEAEEQAIASSDLPSETAVSASLLDASFIPSSEPNAPLMAQAVSAQPQPVETAPQAPDLSAMTEETLAEVAPSVVAEVVAPVAVENVAESQEAAKSESRVEAVEAETTNTQKSSALEDAVREMMKPMVREWLDTNLPKLVEDVVRNELTAALTKK